MDPDQQLRNLKDFLLVYNRMTEICFQRCTSNFNYRNLTMDEERCVDSCAGKLIRSNHRLMGTYMQLMPRMVQRRMEEMESKAAENAKAVAAAVAPPPVDVKTANVDTSPAFQTPLNSPLIPEVQSSVLKSTGLEVLTDPAAAGAKLSAATLLTPKTETMLNDASHTAGSPHLSGFQTESGNPKPPSLSAPTES